MPQRVRAARRGAGGFTLIEMLVTLVVLGVLVAIVVFGLAQFRGDSLNAACHADLKIVTTAANAYELQEGRYPSTLSDLKDNGYVQDPPSGVTYTFDTGAKSVSQGPCKL